MAEIVASAQKIVYGRSSGTENALLWITSLKTAIDTEGFLNQFSAELAALVLETLPTYGLRTQQRAVNQWIRTALEHEEFFKAFAGSVITVCSAKQPPQNACRLLEWSCMVLEQLPHDNAKAVQKLLAAQASQLDTLIGNSSHTGRQRWQAAERVVKRLLRSKPNLFRSYTEAAAASSSPGLVKVTLAAAVQQQQQQQQDSNAAVETLLTVLCDKVLAVREAPRPVQLYAYSPLLSSALTAEQLTGKLVPAACKAMRRTPEPAIASLAGLLQYVALDLSSSAAELVDLLIQQLRAKEAVRRVANDALSSVAARVQDPAVAQQLVRRVCAVLDGSAEGKVKVAAERTALAAALAALADVPKTQPGMQMVATTAATFCSTFYMEEPVEDVKLSLMACLARWLPHCSSNGCPAAVASQLAAGLGDVKDSLRRACLVAALAGIQAEPTMAAQMVALAGPAAKLVLEGCAKAVSRGVGISALLLAAQIAAGSADAGSVLDKAGVWSAALAVDSPLLSASTLAKLSAAEATPVADLARELFTHHSSKLKAGSHESVCRLLSLCLLHQAPEVRRAAVADCKVLLAQQPVLMAPLLAGLRHWANNASKALVLVDVAAGESVSQAVGTYSHRFHTATLTLVPPATATGKFLSSTSISELLLMAHHSAITAGVAHKHATWQVAVSRLQGAVATALQGDPFGNLQVLFGSSGLGSSCSGNVTAAQLALGSVMASAPGACLDPLLCGLSRWLDRSEHDGLNTDDISVYNTPEGILSSEVVPEGVFVPQVVTSKNVRKARGRMRSDNRAFASADDADDGDIDQSAAAKPAPVRSAAAGRIACRGGSAAGMAVSGKGHRDAASRQAEMRAKKLADEAEVRAHVMSVKARLDTGLAAMQAAVEGNTAFAANHLSQLSQLCQPLLSSPISGDAAFSAVRSLARCMPPPLGGRSLLLAGCLRLVSLAGRGAEGVTYSSMTQQTAVGEVIHALYQSTVPPRRALPGPSYALVFPVVSAVLHCPSITPLHDQALAVLALHVAPEQDIPRGESLTLMYHLLGIIPAYRDRVQPLLRSLCSGATDEDLPAAVSGLLVGSAAVSASALLALSAVPTLAEGLPPENVEVLAVLALARHDVDEDNAAAAQQLWEQAGCTLDEPIIAPLARHLASDQQDVRAAAAAALADAVQQHPAATGAALAAVLGLFGDDFVDQDAVAASVLLDDAARQARQSARAAQSAARLGVASGLECLSAVMSSGDVRIALDFLVNRGLGDPVNKVREAMVAAGVALVEAQGELLSQQLLPQFETYLDPAAAARMAAASGQPMDEAQHDLVREGVVVLLGMMAGHLQPGDNKRRSIIDMLLEVLNTPSEAVQRAVSNCLPRLVQPLSEDKGYIEGLLRRLIAALREAGPSGYGLRRGAAYGLSGVVKGLGIGSFKGYGVLESLKAMVENKKDADGREGSLQAFECLCEKLGRLFEPYVIHILPLLLQCFGDPSHQVRAAAEDAARSIMGQLSASGVKLVLPALLKGLEDSAWRTKQGSIQLLGAMAHCAPKQLGSCLPTVVPALGGVLGDAHPRVQHAAKEALQEVGSVIRSPEMSALVPVLLAAIADPNACTRSCLDTLLSTTFVNTIDAPSLALVVPVVHRGLRDRTGDTKKRAARIVGNMCSLTTPKDMTPYVSLLMPELQKALLDPLPEVRATAARAMGSLLKGMGPSALGDLLPWLLTTLRSDGSSVERSGAAQGLAEVVAVLGEDHLSELLPELCAGATSKNPFVREGHLTLFRYLPLTMETSFQAHLGEVLPLILDGLSDEVEGVRDAALAAGRCFVDSYARSCLPLLLPAVEAGLDGDNWRIRQSSLELCGELLFKVAGTSGKVQLDGGSDDEGAACETHGAAIRTALGRERNAEVLSKLYVARSDVQYMVRNTALHIWKTLVVNTPRTLQDILPALMAEVITALADAGEDRRTGAARCLGELVRKMGERVLHRMLPILRATMSSTDSATRQGVCAGLKELLENVTRHQLTEHLAEILPPIQAALCDQDPAVREAAGAAFGVLFKGGAHGAVESVVPSLLNGLESPAHASESLEGLRVILSVRPQVFNGVVPKLLKQPVGSAGLRAIGQLAATAAPVLLHHIPAIMSTCLALASEHTAPSSVAAAQWTSSDNHNHHPSAANGNDFDQQDPRETAAAEAALAVALAADVDSLHVLVAELLKGLEDAAGRAHGTAQLITAYAKATKQDLQPYVDELLTPLVLLLAEDDDDELVLRCWSACDALTSIVPKEDQALHVRALKEALAAAKEKERRKRRGGQLQLRGLLLPNKALTPFVPIYLQGVLQGSSPEVREAAAEGLGELISLTSEAGLKPYVVSITGPLIRIIGDRFPPATKAAILVTLGLLIRRAGASLKPFVPQLQTTFLKCLNDPAPAVRLTAANNLGDLTRLSARVEQLVADLAASAATATDQETAAAYLIALRGGLLSSGDRLSATTLDKVEGQLLSLYRTVSLRASATSGAVDPLAAALVTCMAQYCAAAGVGCLSRVLGSGPLLSAGIPGNKDARDMAAMLLAAVAGSAAAYVDSAGLLREAVEAAVKATRDPEASVKIAGGRAVVRLYETVRNIGPALSSSMTTLLGPDQSSEVQRQALISLYKLAGTDRTALQPHLTAMLPSICSILQRDPNSQVRSAAEQLLKRALRLSSPEASLEVGQAAALSAGGTVKAFLTDAYLRRLSRLAEDEWVEQEEY